MSGPLFGYNKPWRGMDETGGASRGIAAMLVVVFILVAMGLPSFASHGSSFEADDGNLAVDTTDDWANHTPTAVVDLPETVYPGGIRPDTDPNTFTLVASTGGPDKADLTKYNLFLENISGQDWLFLMWQRSSSNGDANVDFEFNQAATADNSTTLSGLPPRTTGDKLITYDFTNGGGANAALSLLTWLPPNSLLNCDRHPQSTPPCWGDRKTLNGVNHAVVNTTTLVDGTDSLSPGQFGEAAINLTSFTGMNTCLRANQVYVHTRTASSFSSAILKDVIPPRPISFNNCPTVSGTKYHDDEADADVSNDGGAGLSGWKINAYKEIGTANGDLSQAEYDAGAAATATTDASGNYSLTLDFGSYVICEELQSTWFQSFPASSQTGECDGITPTGPALGNEGHAVAFTSGTSSTNNHFGNYQNSSISGRKFNDSDGPGSGTTGSNVTTTQFRINLYKDKDGDGQIDADSDPDVDETTPIDTEDTSTSDGTYSFSGVKPGKYIVCEEPETGWTQSFPTGSKCSAVLTDEDGGHAVTLLSQSPSTGNHFGNFTQASISGRKWEDGLNDGLDIGTPTNDTVPSTPFKIWLYQGSPTDSQTGSFPLSSTTDGAGGYGFTNLDPGTYTVCEEKGAAWTQSAPNNNLCSSLGTGFGAGGYSVTLQSGGSATNKDFANFRLGSISGTKFNDDENNGLDSGDSALLNPQHTIKLYSDANKNGTFDTGELEAKPAQLTSAIDGTYSFTGVTPGYYVVCEVGTTGWTQTAPTDAKCAAATTGNLLDDYGHAVTLSSGESETGKDFANFQVPAGSISGFKYHDLDGDGAIDVGEPLLQNWPVTLYKDANNNNQVDTSELLTATATHSTGTPGMYVFSGLAPGNYIVCENAQPTSTDTAWAQSGPTTGATCSGTDLATKGHAVNLATHTSSSQNNNFFNYKVSSVTGTKFNDDDGAGTGTTGAALSSPSFTIKLYKDVDGNGTLSASDLSSQPTGFPQTDATSTSGTYSFTGLAPGKYFVCEAPQGSWTQTAPANTDCQATSDEDGGHLVTLTSDSAETGKDFRNFTSATISGTKVEDGLADGLDTGTAANDIVPGPQVKVWLYLDSDGDGSPDSPQPSTWPKDRTTNATTGAYSFTVDPGSYVVCEEPGTWTQSGPANNTCAGINTSLGDGGYALTVISGETSSGNDFANYEPGSISGKKWNDLDNNGKDSGDVASTTVFTINLYEDKDEDGVLDTDTVDPTKDETTPFDSDTTDPSTGAYSFGPLKPGHYLVCEVGVSGWTQTSPANTRCVSAGTSGGGYAVELGSGQSKTDKDFANFEMPAGSISGFKYHDLDGDGQHDAGEPPLSGWQISLYEDDGDGQLELPEVATVATDPTDTNGAFLFTGVAAGDYLLCEDSQKSNTDTGWLQSAPTSGADCSLVTTNADEGHVVGLATARSTSTGNVFLNHKQATIHVVKTTAPANANQAFDFTGPAQDSDTINPSTTSNDRFSRTVDPGSYTWSEVALDAWRLDSVTCTDSGQSVGKASLGDPAGGSATFKAESDEEVTCTFHNVLRSASAHAVKTTSPSTESKADWSMKLTGPGTPTGGEIVKTDAQGNANFTTPLQEGSYTIEEVNVPAGWLPPTYTNCTFTVDFPADDGKQFTCSVTNTKEATPPPPPPPPPAQGTLVVQKQTLPDGATETFSFGGALTATLGDGQSASGTVDPGTYTVGETTTAGWTLTSITCTDSLTTGQASTGDLTSGTATFRVEANETVTCVFTNSAPPAQGRIVVTKQTLPDGSSESFEFTGDLSGNLSDGDSLTAEVAAGDYTVTESAANGWSLTEISCTDSVDSANLSTINVRQRSATLRVDEGETVECVFTNVEDQVLPKPPVEKPEEEEPEVLPKKVRSTTLPFTGGDPSALVTLAGLLLTLGGSLVLVNRKRR